jgi:uracil-DNA glycosylase
MYVSKPDNNNSCVGDGPIAEVPGYWPSACSVAIFRVRVTYHLSIRNTLERWVFHRTTSISEASNRPVVGPASKLLLHGLG